MPVDTLTLSIVGRDGHPERGNPNDLTITVPDSWRRMFGGSVVEFHGG